MRKAWPWSNLEKKDVIHSKACNKGCNDRNGDGVMEPLPVGDYVPG